MPITVASRQYLSTLHLRSSENAAKQCAVREAELLGVTHYTIDHRSLAINAVLSAVAFLEALGNEVFQDAAAVTAGSMTVRGSRP